MTFIIIVISVFTFLSYYFSSIISLPMSVRRIGTAIFILVSVFMRAYLDQGTNKDYYAYSEIYEYKEFDFSISYFLSEPFLSFLMSVLLFLVDDFLLSLNFIYWINFIFVLYFFTKTIFWDDITFWKKIFFFSYCYIPFSFVFLRNGIPYILIATCFYYRWDNKQKFNEVYISPFIHLSSLPIIILLFIEKLSMKLKLVLSFLVMLIVPFLLGTDFSQIEHIIIKWDVYKEGMDIVSATHRYFLILFTTISIMFIYARKIDSIYVSLFLIYLFLNYVSPVMGHRFSTYLVAYLIFIPAISDKEVRYLHILNIGSLSLILLFIYSLYDTHYL